MTARGRPLGRSRVPARLHGSIFSYENIQYACFATRYRQPVSRVRDRRFRPRRRHSPVGRYRRARHPGQWLEDNPYRGNRQAIEIGASAFGQNCARCHGLDAVSGGIAPDLRELGPEYDEYFIAKVRSGVQRNGMTYMPAFENVLSQEAMWAIRSYIDKRHYEYNDKDLADLYGQADSEG